ELDGALDATRLRAALDALLERHASLRVGVHEARRGEPLQIVRGRVSMPWREHDLAMLTEAERARRADAIAAADCREGFGLERGPLIRATLLKLSPTRARLLLAQHHVIGDGWSASILLHELRQLYRGAALPRPPAFDSYLAWLRRQDRDVARDAWRDYLEGVDGPTL